MDSTSIAEQALQLLFKKLHPHLEDAAHALESGAPAAELLRLHRRLGQARHQAVEILEAWADEGGDEALAEILDTLAANLTPVGETYLQSLVLTQLCLEEAPGDLLPFAAPGAHAWSRSSPAWRIRPSRRGNAGRPSPGRSATTSRTDLRPFLQEAMGTHTPDSARRKASTVSGQKCDPPHRRISPTAASWLRLPPGRSEVMAS